MTMDVLHILYIHTYDVHNAIVSYIHCTCTYTYVHFNQVGISYITAVLCTLGIIQFLIRWPFLML